MDVELLKRPNMTAMIREMLPGDLPLTQMGILPVESVTGRTAEWDIEKSTRQVAKFVGPFSPAKPKKLEVISHQAVRMARSYESADIPAGIFQDLRNPGSDERMRNAERVIARETRELAERIDRANEWLRAKALLGSATFQVDDLDVTVDYGIPASNQFASGAPGDRNIAVSWDDPSADILGDLRRIKKAVALASGHQLRTAICSTRVIHALLANDYVTNMAAGSALAQEYLRTAKITDLFGLTWVTDDATYKDNAGAVQYYIPETKVGFVPAPDMSWGSFMTGSDMVEDDDRQGFSEAQGRYAFSRSNYDPTGLKIFAGEVKLPVIRRPGAIAVATPIF